MKNLKERLLLLLATDKFWLCAVFFITLAAFLPAVKFTDLISDDSSYYIHTMGLRNSLAGIWEPVLGLTTPFTSLSLYADLLLWGEKNFLRGAHFTNILLHSGTALLFYLLLRSLKWGEKRLSPAWAGMAALIFALHPQRVESVVWFSERKDCLAMITGLGAFLLFLRDMRRERIPVSSGLLLTLSFLAKPMWLFFFVPAAALIWIERRSFEWKFYLKMLFIPFGIFAVCMMINLSGLVAGSAAVPFTAAHLFYKLETILFNYGSYFLRTFIPGNLYPVYPHYNPTVDPRWMALIPVGLLLTPFLAKEKECRTAIIYGVLPVLVSFAFILIPMVGFYRVGSTDFADRYSYLPSLFLIAGSAFLLKLNLPLDSAFGRWLPVLGVLYCGGLCYKMELYMPVWENRAAFTGRSMQLRYPHIKTVMVAAVTHFNSGEYEKALKVAEEKLPEFPHYTPVLKNFIKVFHPSLQGMILFQQKKEAEGIVLLNQVFRSGNDDLVRFFPTEFGQRVFSTGGAYYWQKLKDRKTAALLFKRASIIFGDHSPIAGFFYAGMAALVEENYAEAVKNFSVVYKLNPNDKRALYNLNHALKKMKEQKK